ncbi:MAG TPA: anti-sigma factor [Pyrinomonadaceae bacterium]|jgi:hypothetical protein|nr:anti-sigma factor [Pyrinomonadaceae bacterium]
MKCRELQFDLHLYADGELADETAAAITTHLDSCPLCRADLTAIGALRSEMRMMRRPELSAGVYRRLRETVSAEFEPAYGSPTFRLIEGSSGWLKTWMMPTMIGTAASVILGLALLAVILIPSNVPLVTFNTTADPVNREPILLASVPELTPFQYARSRSNISDESPSVNPTGTLVSLTNSFENSQLDNEEVVVVADVFENGAARVTNVVESSKSRSAMARLMRALDGDQTSPPFVPASLDNRSDLVRVVLKFQSVNVNISDDDSFH